MGDISPSDVACAFNSAVREVAALCLALNYPTAASVPHSIMDAYKNMLAIGLACKDYSWENLGKVKEILADPSAFAAAATPAADAGAAVAAGGMFGGSDSSSSGSGSDSDSDS